MDVSTFFGKSSASIDTSCLFQKSRRDETIYTDLWRLKGDTFICLGLWREPLNNTANLEFIPCSQEEEYVCRATEDRRGIVVKSTTGRLNLKPYDDLPEAYKALPTVQQTIQRSFTPK